MEDVRNTYRINEKSELGDVHISDDVLAVISAMAALEVDGVVGMAGNITDCCKTWHEETFKGR